MAEAKQKNSDVSPLESEERGSVRGPELIKNEQHKKEEDEDIREHTLDKTLADSFPTSDPPSSIPDPSEDEFADDNKKASCAPGSRRAVRR